MGVGGEVGGIVGIGVGVVVRVAGETTLCTSRVDMGNAGSSVEAGFSGSGPGAVIDSHIRKATIKANPRAIPLR